MIITISGLPGSGKSTVGRVLAKRLGYRFYSIGDMRGKWAIERGMSINELNKLGEHEDWTDKKADEYQAEMGKKEDNCVIDGRLSFHFIRSSFKVFLTVDFDAGARRIFNDKRSDEEGGTLKEMKISLKNRIHSDDLRYEKLYGLNFRDKRHYDLVIDTTDISPELVVDKIIQAVKKLLKTSPE
jgi:predicted cytidylate kinase